MALKEIKIVFKNEEDVSVEFEKCGVSELLRGAFLMVDVLSQHTGMSKEKTALKIAEYFKDGLDEQK